MKNSQITCNVYIETTNDETCIREVKVHTETRKQRVRVSTSNKLVVRIIPIISKVKFSRVKSTSPHVFYPTCFTIVIDKIYERTVRTCLIISHRET